jgi:alkylation response protein AidB-like acyl-CoA dehydrogenase
VHLTWSEEQEALREAVRDLCAKHASPEVVRSLEDDPAGYRDETWRDLARMDLLGLTIPEEYGGVGQGALENAVVYEEFGRALLPSPHFVTSVLGAGLLLSAGSEAQRKDWLPRIAGGDAILTVAWLEPERSATPAGVAMRADGGRISGEKIMVSFASSASALLVLARTGDGPTDVGLFLVDPASDGVSMRQTTTLASDASYLVAFDRAEAEPLGEPSRGWAAFDDVMTDGLIALACYASGGAGAAHEMAVAYAKERIQFGRPIGSFQAIAHPLAETITEINGGRVLAHEAAWARASGRDAATLAAMAKLVCCDVFKRVTKLGQQVFGGIGFTRDIDMQLYFRRAKQMELSWLDPRVLEERIAAAELDAPIPFVTVDGLT